MDNLEDYIYARIGRFEREIDIDFEYIDYNINLEITEAVERYCL